MKGIRNTLLYILLYCNGINLNAVNQLHKIYHHTECGIEVGKLCCYFSNKLEYSKPKSIKLPNNHEQVSFLLPNVTITGLQAQKMAQQFNNITGAGDRPYTIRFKESSIARNGIEVIVVYDTKKIDMKYNFFDSIGTEKGVEIVFFDKVLLNELGTRSNKKMITMVSNKRKPGIIIDCGHGGTDTGTVNVQNVQEKDITLRVGLKVAQILEQNNIDVLLTRCTDCDVALDQRTLIANLSDKDLYLSIHANNASNNKAMGIETFCLDTNLLKTFFSTVNTKFETFLNRRNLIKNEKNFLFAQAVHDAVLSSVKVMNPQIVDRHVRGAVSQVLLGTKMPSALIEIGFLSNRHESILLVNNNYQQLVAQGISNGVLSYLSSNKSNLKI